MRLWYPQLDAYDSIRRMLAISRAWSEPSLGIERLYVCDFYLANPPLLHGVRKSQAARKKFLELAITKPTKAFVSYPSSPLLFQKMGPVQRQALSTLVGKGLVDARSFQEGQVALTDDGAGFIDRALGVRMLEHEPDLIDFLVWNFSRETTGDIASLRQNTGLRRSVH